MSDLPPIESFAAGLIAGMDPAARQALARDLAKRLRSSQQRRIAAQLNPDGSPFDPRKPQLRHRVGKVRRQMFTKLRLTRYLKTDATPEAAIVAFTQEVQRIAREHQEGLEGIVNKRTGLRAKYASRRLLGLTESDEALVREVTAAWLADRL